MKSENTAEEVCGPLYASLDALGENAQPVAHTPGVPASDETIRRIAQAALASQQLTDVQSWAHSKRAVDPTDAKQSADASLELESVRYEVRALERELAACQAAPSPDLAALGLDLPADDSEEAHKRTIESLETELRRRNELAGRITVLNTERDTLRKRVRKAESSLEALPKRIRRLVAEVAPVRKLVIAANDDAPRPPPRPEDIGLTAWTQLSTPLYVLARQALAYTAAGPSGIALAVRARPDPTRGGEKDETKTLHESHDWKLELEIRETDATQQNPVSTSLGFYYHQKLNIVSVRVAGAEMKVGQLAELVQGDHGRKSPNPENAYRMGGEFVLDSGLLGGGRAFRWANVLCGLHFPPEKNEVGMCANLRFSDMISKIVARVRAAKALRTQILAVKKMVIDRPGVSKPSVDMFDEVEDGAVSVDGQAKEAVVYRLECHVGRFKHIFARIVVAASYPSPKTKLSMERSGTFSEANIRQVERVVNEHRNADADSMLIRQVETYLECVGTVFKSKSAKVAAKGPRKVHGRGRVTLGLGEF